MNSDYELYINMAAYYLRHPSIIPPLYPYVEFVKRFTPETFYKYYNVIGYAMTCHPKSLLLSLVNSCDTEVEYRNCTGVILVSIPKHVVLDIEEVYVRQSKKNLAL